MRASTSAITLSRTFHVLMISTVISKSSRWRLPETTIADCIAELTLPGSDSRQLHDAAILEKCPDHSKPLQHGDIPIKSCSAYALPPNLVNLRKVGGEVETPSNIIGWLETDVLRGIGQDTRMEINRKQAERGCHVTRFEEYD